MTWHLLTFYGICAEDFLYVTTCIYIKYPCVLFMFVLLLIFHSKLLRKYLSKINGYVILKRNCYLLYMCKTCEYVSLVPQISVNLPT